MSNAGNHLDPESNNASNFAGRVGPDLPSSGPSEKSTARPADPASESKLKGPWDFSHCKLEGNRHPELPSHAHAHAPGSPIAGAASASAGAMASAAGSERRRRRRALISAPVRVRSLEVTAGGPDEISTTVDVSRIGFLFTTSLACYFRGMDVAVMFPYSKSPTAIHAEQQGRVARAHQMPDGRYAVAIALGIGIGEDLVDSCGRKLADARTPSSYARDPESTRPLVLAVDADDAVREILRTYLTANGYDVIALKTGAEARQALTMLTPALLIAEVEGEDLPGFDLCAHVKSHPRLRHIPVMLTTRSGNPTDYSNAHSLGAVVCMAKPYKQDRLGHVVRLLAPPPLLKFADTKLNGRNCSPNGFPKRSRVTSAGANGGSSDEPPTARRFLFRPFR